MSADIDPVTTGGVGASALAFLGAAGAYLRRSAIEKELNAKHQEEIKGRMEKMETAIADIQEDTTRLSTNYETLLTITGNMEKIMAKQVDIMDQLKRLSEEQHVDLIERRAIERHRGNGQ